MRFTLVVTSTGRHNLLKQTLDSFRNTQDGILQETIIIEDGDAPRPEWLSRHNTKWLSNGTRRGQIFSVDKAYEQVKTDYVFHCEDDWAFCNPGYISASWEILDKYPDILQVWLRGIPSHQERQNTWTIYDVEPHPTHPLQIANYNFGGWQGGFSFNPGLRRMSDYRRIGSYGRHVGYDPRGCGERALGQLYHSLGYSAAILPERYVYHTGDEVHVDRKVNPEAPKILVAIPTSNKLDYSAFREMQFKTWGKIWHNGVSGLQIDGENLRQKAVQDTWFHDVIQMGHTVKFFTGEELGCGDSHVEMPLKMRAICGYMVENGFDKMFRCDDDTYVRVDRMIRQGIELTDDYAGVNEGGFAIGGPGIWMSRKSCEVIAQAVPPDYQTEWRDDAWMGQVLREYGITVFNDLPGLGSDIQAPLITAHPISPSDMRRRYAEYYGPTEGLPHLQQAQ